MIRETRCLVLVCDGCPTVLAHPDTDGEIHYDTPEEARRDAVEDLSWSQQDGRDLCPACSCATEGHRWAEWTGSPSDPQVGPYRWCERCSAVEIQGQGVLGHD